MTDQPQTHIPSYGKVLNLGHRDLEELLTPGDRVVVQEKIDGSQFSWTWAHDGRLRCRSKGKTQWAPGWDLDDADGLFRPAIEHLIGVSCPEGADDIIFRGEVVAKPRHNTLTYDRVPAGFLVLYDAEIVDGGGFMTDDDLQRWAPQMGVEVARTYRGPDNPDNSPDPSWLVEDLKAPGDVEALLERESMLGGKIEGVVLKNYRRTNQRTGRPFLAGKVVRPEFKETHKRQWKKDNPGQGDVVEQIITALNTEARWEKAVQYLRDQGELVNGPQDIGPLMRRVSTDTLEEEMDWILEKLQAFAMAKIKRGLGRGLPEWYKAKLAEGGLPTT